MNILGVYASEYFGHPAGCLLKNGKMIALCEEERLIRDKQAVGRFPSRSIEFCLKKGKLSLEDISYIAFGWDANKYRIRFPFFIAGSFIKESLNKKKEIDSFIDNTNFSLKPGQEIGSGILSGLKDLLCYQPRSIRENIILGLNDAGFMNQSVPPIVFIDHHFAHALSSFYCSGFEESAILVYDGHGEENTISIYKGTGMNLRLLHRTRIPHSLGWFYSMFTEYLGWNPNEGEVKLMGLAPYGEEDPFISKVIDDILYVNSENISLNTAYTFYKKRSCGKFFSDLLPKRLGPPRSKNEPLTSHHKNIACCVQKKLETAGLFLAQKAFSLSHSNNLCISGGVGLNCKLNGVINEANFFKKIFVQPISYDAGVSMGSAFAISMKNGADPRFEMSHPYWGPSFNDEDIENILLTCRISFVKLNHVAKEAARLISRGEIIAWFQGAMEAGPRALGNRSILAHPGKIGLKDNINRRIKFRENWRPFAISILEEFSEEYFYHAVKSPFMTIAFKVKPEKIDSIRNGIHEGDLTCRPQTVSMENNPLYYQLIREFYELTNIPAILNTSFNVKGEPIVSTPTDAIRCFYGSGIDTLIIGPYLIKKDGKIQ